MNQDLDQSDIYKEKTNNSNEQSSSSQNQNSSINDFEGESSPQTSKNRFEKSSSCKLNLNSIQSRFLSEFWKKTFYLAANKRYEQDFKPKSIAELSKNEKVRILK